MKDNKDEFILRALDGALSEEEKRLFAASPSLQADLEAVRKMRGLLRASVGDAEEEGLKPFFTDRVMRRLTPASAQEDAAQFFDWLFRRVALAGLVIILALAAYNFNAETYDAERSVVEMAFALPPVTLDTAYDLDITDNP